jgi:hypothetical protein
MFSMSATLFMWNNQNCLLYKLSKLLEREKNLIEVFETKNYDNCLAH